VWTFRKPNPDSNRFKTSGLADEHNIKLPVAKTGIPEKGDTVQQLDADGVVTATFTIKELLRVDHSFVVCSAGKTS
jgi:hypothetical protein